MSRSLTFVLLASLALNVFLGGFVAGRLFGGPRHDHRTERSGPHVMAPMFSDLSALSDEERKAFHAVFKKKRAALRDNFKELRGLRQAFGEALAAEPWDRTKAEAALDALSAVESEHQLALARLLIDAFEGLSPEDRKALVEAQASRRDGWRRGPRRGMRGDGPPSGPPDDASSPDDRAPPPPPEE